MNLNTDPDPPPAVNTQADCVAALRWGFEAALARGARQITCVSPHFVDWPLDDPALLQALSTWLRLPQRRLLMLAASYHLVPDLAPRFTRWRRDWSHAVLPWLAPAELASTLIDELFDDSLVCVKLIDFEQGRGFARRDSRLRHGMEREIDAVLQRSEAGFPVNTLGL